jgi:hypothetical protein
VLVANKSLIKLTPPERSISWAYHPLHESLWLAQVSEEKRDEILATAVDLYNGPLNQMLGSVKSDAEIEAILAACH